MKNFYIVRFGFDLGGAESGPDFQGGYVVIKARNKKSAENRIDNSMSHEYGYEGCFAKIATEEETNQFMQEMKENQEEFNHLIDSGIINPIPEQMYDGTELMNMPIAKIKDRYYDYGYEREYIRKGGIYQFVRDARKGLIY